jgi:hypothetical protein
MKPKEENVKGVMQFLAKHSNDQNKMKHTRVYPKVSGLGG